MTCNTIPGNQSDCSPNYWERTADSIKHQFPKLHDWWIDQIRLGRADHVTTGRNESGVTYVNIKIKGFEEIHLQDENNRIIPPPKNFL